MTLAGAVFESLRAVAECAVAEAVKRAPPPTWHAPRPSRVSLYGWERLLWLALKDDGFGLVQCEHNQLDNTCQMAVRHECGAWCVLTVDGRDLAAAASVPEHARRLFDRFGCYCVKSAEEQR